MGHAALGRMNRSAAQLFLRHLFAGHGLHDLRAGNEHIAAALAHQDEVGQRGRINRAAGARSENSRDLRDNARSEDVALEDFGITGQTVHALLDTRAARIVDSDHRSPVFHRHIHHFADLSGEGFGQRTAEHGEILREHVYLTAVDRTVAGYDAVAEIGLFLEAEIIAAVLYEHIELFEGTFVEQ